MAKKVANSGKPTAEHQGVHPGAGGNRQRGIFAAFGYSADAEHECSAFHKRTGRIIKLLTVQEILDEEYVQKM